MFEVFSAIFWAAIAVMIFAYIMLQVEKAREARGDRE